jgi:hypothetical protein
MHTVSAVTKQSLKHEKIGDLSLYRNCIEERSWVPKAVELFEDMKALKAILLHLLASGSGGTPMASESFLFKGNSWRDRTLNAPLLVSAASDSSEAVTVVLNGDVPIGRHDTGNPSSDTSCSHTDSSLVPRNTFLLCWESGVRHPYCGRVLSIAVCCDESVYAKECCQ